MKTLPATLAFLFVPLLALADAGSQPAVTALASVLGSSACNGSCVAVLRTGAGQVFLEVRDPVGGHLFKLVGLDIPADAKVSLGGPGSIASSGDPTFSAQAPAPERSARRKSARAAGTLRESLRFSAGRKRGEVQVTYVVVDQALKDVVVQKVEF